MSEETYILIAKLRDALLMLERTGRGLENTLKQDLSPLTEHERKEILWTAFETHGKALAIAQHILKETHA